MVRSAEPSASLLRRGLLWLGTLTALGLALELIIERHWTQPVQFVAWGALVLLAVAIALLWCRPSPGRVRLARVLALLVMASAAIGVWEHIAANYDAGPLDYRYAKTWGQMSALARWWLAARGGVGPSPPLAPGALAQVGFAVLLATLRHPAFTPEEIARPTLVAARPAESERGIGHWAGGEP